MKVEELLGQSGEWLKGTGPESDVVISSRVRLARNLHRFPFLTVATPQVRTEIEKFIRPRLEESKPPRKLTYWSLREITPIERSLLVERHLISKEHAQADGERGVAVGAGESISIMVNEEDHLRLQVIRSGLQLDEAFEEIDGMDTSLEGQLNFAFHSRFGYLTACPTNVGTGLRISVMMHLPAAVLSKQMDKVLQSLQRLNYTVRGFYGEGTSPLGDFYQVSNQVTLGKSERDIIAEMKKVVPEILKFERSWRIKLLEDEPRKLEDRVWRAYGILKHARRITSEEATEHLSALRLGANMNLIQGVAHKVINELFIFTQPGHLQKIERKVLEPEERDAARAEFIRRKLEGL
ncbi:MAG TPA: protein arginine kinase [Planctomycetota bacterium]|nr:protein arginine kinase [Planctomycetota bacterium]